MCMVSDSLCVQNVIVNNLKESGFISVRYFKQASSAISIWFWAFVWASTDTDTTAARRRIVG